MLVHGRWRWDESGMVFGVDEAAVGHLRGAGGTGLRGFGADFEAAGVRVGVVWG